MRLLNGILRPGIVTEVLDNGLLRASVPGLFSNEDTDKQPPIYPFAMGPANSFSSVKLGEEVWVLSFTDNPLQLYWFRKDYSCNYNKDIIKGANVEVLCNRETPMGTATIYFADGEGWIIKNGESHIQINADGDIILDHMGAPHRSIIINSEGVHLGGGMEHPAVYGDKLIEVLDAIVDVLVQIRAAAGTNTFTSGISTAINSIPEKLSSEIEKITSPIVTLD